MPKITCNDPRTQEINERLFNRNLAIGKVDVAYGIPSVPTKYTTMHIHDVNSTVNTSLVKAPIYNTSQNFLPGDRKPHWSGFSTTVDTESNLRNQFFSLQKCDQREYIPSSNSDLYKLNVKTNTTENMEHSLLFNNNEFNKFNPNIDNIGNNLFYNHTRVQRNED